MCFFLDYASNSGECAEIRPDRNHNCLQIFTSNSVQSLIIPATDNVYVTLLNISDISLLWSGCSMDTARRTWRGRRQELPPLSDHKTNSTSPLLHHWKKTLIGASYVSHQLNNVDNGTSKHWPCHRTNAPLKSFLDSYSCRSRTPRSDGISFGEQHQ